MQRLLVGLALTPMAVQVSWLSVQPAHAVTVQGLYAAQVPVFVADAYAKRVGLRHGLLEDDLGYEAIQLAYTSGVPVEAQLYNEYHALLVRVGKEHCTAAEPDCRGCPLESTLEGVEKNHDRR